MTATSTVNQGYGDANSLIKKSRKKGIHSLEQGARQAQPYYQQSVDTFSPYNESGQQANTGINDLLGYNGPEAQAAAQARIKALSDQGLAPEGEQAVLRNNAALGGVASGNAMVGLNDYAQKRAWDTIWAPYLNLAQGQAGRGIQGATGMAQGLTNLGNMYNELGQNKAQVQLGTYGNQATLAQQQANQLAQMQQAQQAQDQQFWNNLISGGLQAAGKIGGAAAGNPGAFV